MKDETKKSKKYNSRSGVQTNSVTDMAIAAYTKLQYA